MAEQHTILTFEEGVAGATIDDAAAIRKPPKWDDTPSSATITGCRYGTNAHDGSLAATVDQTLGGGTIAVIAAAPNATGGGAWINSLTPSSFDGDPIASVAFRNDGSPLLTRGIGIYYNAATNRLEARIGFTVIASTSYVSNRWMQLHLAPSGTWTLTDPGGTTLMTGTVTAAADSPYDSFVFFAQSGSSPGSALVDDVWLWWQADGPVVRLYPRDDGRGMSSAPRIWPHLKGRSRIIGGYQ